MLILTIGFCTFATAFISDLEESLHQLQRDLNIMKNKNGKISNAIQIGLQAKLVNFIQFYAEARELSVECLTSLQISIFQVISHSLLNHSFQFSGLQFALQNQSVLSCLCI